jgi:preprotein translocase subunit YajC
MNFLMILAESDDSSGGGAALVQLGILLLIPLALYFLMIRPQRRRMREQASLQSGLEVGDEIVTTSGLYGFITGFDEDRVWLEIDEDVQIRLARAAISGKVNTSTPPADPRTKPELPESTADKSSDTTE